jgi:hypothetical protein
MIENIQHDYFIWEEKSSTEPQKNYENNGVNEEAVSTNETKNDSTQKDWKDITNPKERRKAYNKAYRDSNKERKKAYVKAYREVNKDKINVKSKAYYEANRDKILLQQKDYFEANKDKIRLQQKDYFEANKDKINSYYKNKLKTDIQYKLSRNLRNRLRDAVKNNYKAGSAVKDLGCSIKELKQHLESKFLPGMSWDNWTFYGWHIDHIKPLSSFNLRDRNQLLEACHYTNLQPLWATDNLIKSDNII